VWLYSKLPSPTLYLAHRGHVVTTTYIMNYRPQYTSVSDELTIVEHSAISVEIVFHFLKSFHRESHNGTSKCCGDDDISRVLLYFYVFCWRTILQTGVSVQFISYRWLIHSTCVTPMLGATSELFVDYLYINIQAIKILWVVEYLAVVDGDHPISAWRAEYIACDLSSESSSWTT